MKAILNICSAAGFACVLWFAAAMWLPSSPTGVASKSGGGARNPHAQGVEFGSHARSKVVQYFDTYRAEPLGLPSGCATRMKTEEIPASWSNRGNGIARGAVIPENERPVLLDAPADLAKMMPAGAADVRYFLAGANLVVLDGNYKVLESVAIPTVRLHDQGALMLVRHLGRHD